MSELVTRAHNYVATNTAESGADVLIVELADRIETLEAALQKIIDHADLPSSAKIRELARDALAAEPNK